MSLPAWTRLVGQNNYDIHHWPMAAMVTLCAAGNSILGKVQDIAYDKKIAAKELVGDPVFILGHWRTGTTLLHELMALDERFAIPNNYQCFAPNHFLISESVITKVAKIPSKRPQDNVEISWTSPQEDEFAICNYGLPTPYSRIAFPNRPARHYDYLNMEGLPMGELEKWKAGLMQFIKNLNYANDKPIVLKSPTHTGRVKVLLNMFPNARFIHLSRNPHEFIPSTFHMWRALDDSNGLQRPIETNQLHDHVFESFRRMYRGYDKNRELIPDGSLVEVRFEDLTTNTVESMESIYAQLRLGDFESMRKRISDKLAEKKRYKRNKHNPSDELTGQISAECGDYIRNYCQPNTGLNDGNVDQEFAA